MKARVKIEGDTLEITLTGVQDLWHDRGRVANIEMALLRSYSGHRSLPWIWKDDGFLVQWVRGDANHIIADDAREVLRSFCLEV